MGCSSVKVVLKLVVVQKRYTKKEWGGSSCKIVVLKLVVVQKRYTKKECSSIIVVWKWVGVFTFIFESVILIILDKEGV